MIYLLQVFLGGAVADMHSTPLGTNQLVYFDNKNQNELVKGGAIRLILLCRFSGTVAVYAFRTVKYKQLVYFDNKK